LSVENALSYSVLGKTKNIKTSSIFQQKVEREKKKC